jgi:phage antirepressor YoqD-like protein
MLPDYPAALRQWASQIEKNGILENQIKESAPKVELADNFLKSDGDFYIRVVAKAIGIGVEKLFDWLRAHKIITKFNEPYAEFSKRGILRPRAATFTRSDGTSQTRLTTKITTNGIYYIRDRLIKEGLLPQNTQIDFDFLAQESKK